MAQKKLMLLGGLRYLKPVIDAAHKQGYYVITADYLPDNIAHKWSDEYCNVSIIDKDAVLREAEKLHIDGILSYAVDPGVVSAAYVAERMGLPFSCSYKTACILQDKALFRKFLTENGFNVPVAKGYSKSEDAIKDKDNFNWPVIVKPVDSAGSKGVTKVENPVNLIDAINHALDESHNGHFIIEDFLEKDGMSSGSESFFVEGELKYNAFYDQYFDVEANNPYIPSAECWPSEKSEIVLNSVREQLQRLSHLLDFRTGLFNIEWRVCKDGKVYLMEVSPRAGGNRLAEILNYATDVNIIESEMLKAINEPLPEVHEPHYNGHYCILVLHSDKRGSFDSIEIDKNFGGEVLEEEIRINKGAHVMPFFGANNALGTLFLRFSTREKMINALNHQKEWLKVNIKQYE
jgi:formate-dependent phosphoribosylglycinamide formyltransferase (GAR transformylase)